MSNTDSELNTVEWNQLPWRKIQKVVFKLQKRIYRAYINGDVRKGRRIQKTLIKSYYNRLLSVRKVTQDNSGKKTAGVDKVKSLTPVAIKRHIKVKGNKTPFDGDTTYWGTRMGQHPELKASIAKLLKKQEGKCNWCKLPFQVEDLIESDHIIPKSIGGLNTQDNLQLLHKHCHDIKTSNDLMLIKKHKETN